MSNERPALHTGERQPIMIRLRSNSEKRCCRILPVAVIAVLCAVFFAPVLFQGKTFLALDTLLDYLPWKSFAHGESSSNPLITDPINAFLPFHLYFKECIRNLDIPFWFSNILCGTPSAGPYSSPILYVLYGTLPATFAHDALLLLCLMASGILAYLFLRELRCSASASMLGAIAWMFNGFFMVWFEFDYSTLISATLPAVFYATHVWWRRRDSVSFLCLILCWAMACSSGHIQLLIYQCVLYALYVLLYGAQLGATPGQLRRGISETAGSFGALLAGSVVSASIFCVLLSMNDGSQRVGFAYSELFKMTGMVTPKWLVTLLFPDYFGNPSLGGMVLPRVRPYDNYNELCIYAGVLPVFLWVAALVGARRRSHTVFFVTAGVVTLAMAMGSILYFPLAEALPGLKYSTPTRILYLFGFCVAVAAALGADGLQKGEVRRKGVLVAIWCLIAASVSVFALISTQSWYTNWLGAMLYGKAASYPQIALGHFSLRSSILLLPAALAVASGGICIGWLQARTSRQRLLIGVLACLVLAVDLMPFGARYNTTSPRQWFFPRTPAIDFLMRDTTAFRTISLGGFLHNSLSPYGIEDVGGYASFYPRQYGDYLQIAMGDPDLRNAAAGRWTSFDRLRTGPLVNLANVKYFLLPPSARASIQGAEMVFSGEVNIYENRDVFPRAFFASDFRVVDNRDSLAHALFYSTDSLLRAQVLLEKAPREVMRRTNGASASEVTILRRSSTRVDVSVNASSPGFLVYCDNFHPAWEVYVDGRRDSLLRADFTMRAVQIDLGKHLVSMRYRPWPTIAGFAFSAACWLTLGILLCVALARRRTHLRAKDGYPQDSGGRAAGQPDPQEPEKPFSQE